MFNVWKKAVNILSPLHSTPLHSTPLHSTPLHSTPLHSTPLHSTPLHPTKFHSTFHTHYTPLHTPLHSTLHTSLHTPPHSTPLLSHGFLLVYILQGWFTGTGAIHCPSASEATLKDGGEVNHMSLLRTYPNHDIEQNKAQQNHGYILWHLL